MPCSGFGTDRAVLRAPSQPADLPRVSLSCTVTPHWWLNIALRLEPLGFALARRGKRAQGRLWWEFSTYSERVLFILVILFGKTFPGLWKLWYVHGLVDEAHPRRAGGCATPHPFPWEHTGTDEQAWQCVMLFPLTRCQSWLEQRDMSRGEAGAGLLLPSPLGFIRQQRLAEALFICSTITCRGFQNLWDQRSSERSQFTGQVRG